MEAGRNGPARASGIDDQPQVHAALEVWQRGVLRRWIAVRREVASRIREDLEAAEDGEGQLCSEVVARGDAEVEAITENRVAAVACRDAEVGARRRADRHEVDVRIQLERAIGIERQASRAVLVAEDEERHDARDGIQTELPRADMQRRT